MPTDLHGLWAKVELGGRRGRAAARPEEVEWLGHDRWGLAGTNRGLVTLGGECSELSAPISHLTGGGGEGPLPKRLWSLAPLHSLEGPVPDVSHLVVAELGDPLRARPAFQVGQWLSCLVRGLLSPPGSWTGGEQLGAKPSVRRAFMEHLP